MSEILVNEIKHRNGTSAIAINTSAQMTVRGEGGSATTNLQQGLAKVFHSVDQTGTMTTLDSFNVSSVTDQTTGSSSSSFSNNMNNVNYAYNLTRDRTGSQNGGVVQTSSTTAPQTTSLRYNCFQENFGSQDVDRVCLSTHGDLA